MRHPSEDCRQAERLTFSSLDPASILIGLSKVGAPGRPLAETAGL
jgi:hypothetical protein